MDITIGGRQYHVTRDDTVQGPRWFVETGNGSQVYEVRRELAEARNCYLPYACDCPDFTFRHAGTGTDGCKHLAALSSYGLLPSLDCQPEYREAR